MTIETLKRMQSEVCDDEELDGHDKLEGMMKK